MKKIFFFAIFVCSINKIVAQDFGASAYIGNYFPLGSLTKSSPVTNLNLEITWWNPDKGFPVIGLIGYGFHYEIPGKAEVLDYTNNTGQHHADVIRHSYGYSGRYAWEITQPIQHLSVYAGLGTTTYFTKLQLKPETPLLPGDYVTDSNGNTWDYTGNSDGGFRRLSFVVNFFAGASYELPKFNLFGQLSYSLNGEGTMPFIKAAGLSVGIFVPLLRR